MEPKEFSSTEEGKDIDGSDHLDEGLTPENDGVVLEISPSLPTYVPRVMPVIVSWHDVGYTIKGRRFLRRDPSRDKVILKNCSGYCKPGQLLGIFGCTGAGKSTLMDIIAGCRKAGAVEGVVRINGRPPEKMKHIFGYVSQQETLMSFQKVYETIRFSADLQLSADASYRNLRCHEIIEELGLQRVQKSFIGNPFKRSISGGELKRTNIAHQLVTDPGLLLLDEPTTGLDSPSALAVFHYLKKLTRKLPGRAIIVTVHQPRYAIFKLLDLVCILSQGQTVFFGSSTDAIPYFEGMGYMFREGFNPADFMLDVAHHAELVRDGKELEEETLMLLKTTTSFLPENPHLQEYYNENCEGDLRKTLTMLRKYVSRKEKEHRLRVEETEEAPGLLYGVFLLLWLMVKKFSINFLGLEDVYAVRWATQVFYVSRREVYNLLRNPIQTYAQLGMTIFFALLVGSIFFDLPTNQSSIQDRFSVLYFVVVNVSFGAQSVLLSILEERDNISRERAATMYSTSAFFFSKNIVLLPWLAFFPFLSTCIVYFMVGFQPNLMNFLTFATALVMVVLVASGLFLLIASVSPNLRVAQILAPLVLVLFFLFGGFFISEDNVPVYWIWVYYLSYFRYAFEIIAYNEFSGLEYFCEPEELLPDGTCLFTSGDQILAANNLDDVNIMTNFAILTMMALGYRILAYFPYRFLYREKR